MSENKTENTEVANSSASVSLNCIYGVKSGMTRVITEDGRNVPVTVISLKDNTVVTQVKSKDKDGYNALQLGFLPKKAQRVNKASKGHFQKAGSPGFYFVEEYRLTKADPAAAVGAALSPEFLVTGTIVDIQGTTKGKGFQGVMKRWNFGGQPATHGHSVSHRSPGSIGNRADPGRVFPGKKMATHMGMDTQTTQNIEVVAYDKDEKVLLVSGAVPGAKSWVVRITAARKKVKKAAAK